MVMIMMFVGCKRNSIQNVNALGIDLIFSQN